MSNLRPSKLFFTLSICVFSSFCDASIAGIQPGEFHRSGGEKQFDSLFSLLFMEGATVVSVVGDRFEYPSGSGKLHSPASLKIALKGVDVRHQLTLNFQVSKKEERRPLFYKGRVSRILKTLKKTRPQIECLGFERYIWVTRAVMKDALLVLRDSEEGPDSIYTGKGSKEWL